MLRRMKVTKTMKHLYASLFHAEIHTTPSIHDFMDALKQPAICTTRLVLSNTNIDYPATGRLSKVTILFTLIFQDLQTISKLYPSD